MKCSVVILNWNGVSMLRQYLPSVVRWSSLPGCEVVVADNGSSDDSLAFLAGYPDVRIVSFPANYGFAEGYNRALAHTDAEYTVLLNSDVEVTEGWLCPLLDYMDNHPEVAACQPKILSFLSKREYDKGIVSSVAFEHAGAAGGYMDILGYPYCRGRILGYVENDHGQYDDIAPVFWASGACLCIRTDVYKREGGLDARFFAHMEEIDLCWRLQCRGYRIVCVPSSTVYHLGGGSLNYENPRKTYLNFRNNLLMLYKNMPAGKLWWVWILRFMMDYAASLQFLFAGKLSNFRAVIRARFDFWRQHRLYRADRLANLRKAVVPLPDSVARRSVVFDYYIRGKRQ